MSRAIVIHAAHDLRVEPREALAPGPGQVRVRIRAGGICGSDLHYFQHGGFGAIRVKHPMVLGHEVAGEIEALGAGVAGLALGQAVAVNPSLPCGRCRYCLDGAQQHCLDMRFYGSAMRDPHVDGGFREALVCEAAQAVPLPQGLDTATAAFAEPLAVCLHAARQAGPLLGRRVLVTGCGPIGALAIAAARMGGAREIVATDLSDAPRSVALRMGADRFHADADALAAYAPDKGFFDIAMEASGSPRALLGILPVLRPGGIIVQIGIGGDAPVPMSVLAAKEITWRGTFRFHAEFAMAVEALAARRIDVAPLLTERFPIDRAVEAFELAADRSRAMKVQIAF
ncbi:L-idonate 5-dehydrogenase [Roseomonas sp. PWR1]|uniref:L-idonate 5-dehydrogenase n=1 Tax=Roseomonas nitratireducens TaxID=2820810 RepID=A0ABS4APC4_9PROT|nr:L-idonate 5-dehydrogenase [Neoroseomonas nitratireducens]MBP0463216.1 L-idonate 5-dehydrogenase [Neoroseomonas nitratireducens]